MHAITRRSLPKLFAMMRLVAVCYVTAVDQTSSIGLNRSKGDALAKSQNASWVVDEHDQLLKMLAQCEKCYHKFSFHQATSKRLYSA